MSKILITGAANGLGNAIINALSAEGHITAGYDIEIDKAADVRNPPSEQVIRRQMRCSSSSSPLDETLDVLINCAGVNEQEWLREMSDTLWDRVMDVNARGIWKMTKACLPLLIESKGTVLNITSNAAWMPMTCSIAYNASKAAAHIMTQQMARELTKKYGITVFGIAPNKLRGTRMSRDIEEEVLRTRGWTKEFAEQYQKNALLTGEETEPKVLAEFIAFLLSKKERHQYLSGCIIPYGA